MGELTERHQDVLGGCDTHLALVASVLRLAAEGLKPGLTRIKLEVAAEVCEAVRRDIEQARDKDAGR